jgi:hypothetical protein
MRALQQRLRAGDPARVRTPRDLLTGVGRLVLWLVVALLLVHGAGDMLGPSDDAPEPRLARAEQAPGWPNDAARALAVEFATAYLTYAPGEDPDAAAQRVNAFASAEVVRELVPHFDRGTPAQAVRSAAVARTVTLDARHALVTVAATLATDGQLGTRRLTVPIARDDAGGLVIDDLPSFAAAPARAATAPRDEEPLLGADRGAIEDVLTRFLRSYLAGDTGGMAYLVVPGTRIAAAAGRLELLSLTSVTVMAPAERGRRVMLVTVHVRDVGSRAVYMLRYRVRLVRRDRWYVAELNEEGSAR